VARKNEGAVERLLRTNDEADATRDIAGERPRLNMLGRNLGDNAPAVKIEAVTAPEMVKARMKSARGVVALP
jgi:hypothetical protein